jgi:apolipoprotein N-acyltransferase
MASDSPAVTAESEPPAGTPAGEPAPESAVPEPASAGPARRWHPGALWRQLVAVASGLLLYASFPPRPLWFLAPVAIAALTLTLRARSRPRGGFGLGFLAGLGFFVPLLPWVGAYVGPLPWLALAVVLALYVGLFGLGARLVATLPGWPVWTAAVWSLTEWFRSVFPFGGFPWGRLAFGQPGGVLLPIAELGGAPLLSFAVALTGTGLAALMLLLRDRSRAGLAAAAATFLVAPALGALLWPFLPTMADGRQIVVAAVQGSVPRLGLDFNAQRRAVLDNHVRATERLAADIQAGRVPKPDVVIWPENSSDIDPLRNDDAALEIAEAAQLVDAPILVGSVLLNDDGRTTTNSVIVWTAANGPGERHDKRIIQPFGEYLPYRGFFRHFSSYADRAGYFVPGHDDGVVHADGVPIGIATCYEVVFDRAFETSARAGAQLLAVPTNNATFGDTEMTYQQLAMSRVRAVEHARAVVIAATSGVSAIIGPDGTVTRRTPKFVQQVLVARVPLRRGTTLATRLGPAPEVVLCAGAGIALVVAVVRRRKTATKELC